MERAVQIIHDDPAMPDEIAAGFYPGFEHGWRITEVIGRTVMAIFVLGCLAGLLGSGPLNRRSAANEDSSLTAHYDAVVRSGAPTVVSLDTRVPSGGSEVAVTVSRDLVDDLVLSGITPNPRLWQVGNNSIRITFPVVAGEKRAFIRLSGSPDFIGRRHFTIRLDGGETLSWSQIGVP